MNIIGFINKYHSDIDNIKQIINTFLKNNYIQINDSVLLNEHMLRYIYNNSRNTIKDNHFNNHCGYIDTTDYYKQEYLSKFEELHNYIKTLYFQKNEDFMYYTQDTDFSMIILEYTEKIEPEYDEEENNDFDDFYYNDYLIK
tara:strand:- start:3284 stop:3709 length:426 start_codon:yes stop_codon:yes gene_type:complete